jgi:hypothetical protein
MKTYHVLITQDECKGNMYVRHTATSQAIHGPAAVHQNRLNDFFWPNSGTPRRPVNVAKMQNIPNCAGNSLWLIPFLRSFQAKSHNSA